MKNLTPLLLLPLLLATHPLTAASPGGNVGVAADPAGKVAFLHVDALGRLLLAGSGPGLGMIAPGGNVGIALDPSGNYAFLNVDSGGGLIVSGGGGGGGVTSVTGGTSGGLAITFINTTTTPSISSIVFGDIAPSTVDGLTLAAQTVGFTVAGGTTSKTLTVSDTSSINQNVTKTGTPTFTSLLLSNNTAATRTMNNGFDLVEDGVPAAVAVTNYGTSGATNSAGFFGIGARGTLASPSAVQTDDVLLSLGGSGWNGSAFSGGSKGALRVNAAENWTSAHEGTYINFFTTPKLSTTKAEVARLTDAGALLIGITTPAGSEKLNVNGAAVISGTISGAAGNMTIIAGTGNSRTMSLQSTTSGGSATTFLTGNADQTVTLPHYTTAGILTNAVTTGAISSRSDASSADSTLLGIIGSGSPTSSNYLRGDGSWAVPPGTVTNTNGTLTQYHVMFGEGGADSFVDSAVTTDGAGTWTGFVSLGTAAVSASAMTLANGATVKGDTTAGHTYLFQFYYGGGSPGYETFGTATNSATVPTFVLDDSTHGTVALNGTLGSSHPHSVAATTLSASSTFTLSADTTAGILVNAVTTGIVSSVTAIPNGITASTQAIQSGDTKVATDAYADRAGNAGLVGLWATPDTTAAVAAVTLTGPVTIINTDPTAALRTYQLPAAATGNKGQAVELIVTATQLTYHVNLKPATSDVFYLKGAALTVNHYIQDASTTAGDYIVGVSDGAHWSFEWGTGYSGATAWADAASP